MNSCGNTDPTFSDLKVTFLNWVLGNAVNITQMPSLVFYAETIALGAGI